ncbi:MAG TPA: hypothetical protein VKR32_07460 [Puia sp.]|nr:hypothetical protein [Puia sp.]
MLLYLDRFSKQIIPFSNSSPDLQLKDLMNENDDPTKEDYEDIKKDSFA